MRREIAIFSGTTAAKWLFFAPFLGVFAVACFTILWLVFDAVRAIGPSGAQFDKLFSGVLIALVVMAVGITIVFTQQYLKVRHHADTTIYIRGMDDAKRVVKYIEHVLRGTEFQKENDLHGGAVITSNLGVINVKPYSGYVNLELPRPFIDRQGSLENIVMGLRAEFDT